MVVGREGAGSKRLDYRFDLGNFEIKEEGLFHDEDSRELKSTTWKRVIIKYFCERKKRESEKTSYPINHFICSVLYH